MKVKTLLSLVLLLGISSTIVKSQVQSPKDFLGYELGEHFTPHHKVMSYFKHIADESGMVSLEKYGETNERRDLMLAFVASEANHARLDEIRLNNLRRTGLEEGTISGDKTAIVWLSYNVHGNEASSSEAAMKTLWELVNPENEETKNWLNTAIVIMDPMINPDGRDRYVNWYNTTVGKQMNPYFDGREHHEPWPQGRVNHYYFDLNRDWAWQTQIESEQRAKKYHEWMPHIHVDFHEQFHNSPYYFAPAAEPFHAVISDWQRDFQTTIGKNHAKYFDEKGWLYFTKEVFDLFYPSYGDTWPTYNGAIGMTYEQAGHTYAGLGIIKAEGDTLTLKDRLTHHATAGLSTIEITAINSDQVVDEFQAYFDKVRKDGSGDYKHYVVSQENNKDKIMALLDLLDKQKIEYKKVSQSKTVSAFDYKSGSTKKVSVKEGDILVTTLQPKGNMARVLFEPNPYLPDSVTYDITAWSMMYAYGLNGYATNQSINSNDDPIVFGIAEQLIYIPNVYAYALEWKSTASLKFLTKVLKRGVQVRFTETAFEMDGKSFDPGTLIITKHGNEKLGDEFERIVEQAAISVTDTRLYRFTTGFVDKGKDFGSGDVKLINTPRIALMSGSGTSSNDVGFIWHYFDHQIDYPITMINLDDAGSVDWSEYDVLIMPSGSYGSAFGGEALEELSEWIQSGGRVVAVGGGAGFFAGKDGYSLERKSNGSSGDDTDDKLAKYGDRERSSISTANPGSIFKVELDNTHPLAFGYDEIYFSLKVGTSSYDYLENGWNVGVAKEDAHRAGFVGYEAKDRLENTLVFGVQNKGAGEVVYLVDNPLYRGFWEDGKLLFGNAVFIVGN